MSKEHTVSTIVIAGASGFLGRHLSAAFAQDGWRVRTIGRSARADARWGEDLRGTLDGAQAVLNLAGRSVSCRYTKTTADEIFASRTETTAELGRALAACAAPPPAWLNASTGTIYRDARDRAQTEAAGELGSGFSVAVARAWEYELAVAPAPVRKLALRMSIVLGTGGGALNPLINLARLGFGGRQGDGGQVFSWIHTDDVYAAIRHLIDTPDLWGPVNIAAPEPVTNTELMTEMREVFGPELRGGHAGVPLPAPILKLGGRIIRTEPELVLKSRWVAPQVLLDSGFVWRYPTLRPALDAIAEQTPRGLLPVTLG